MSDDNTHGRDARVTTDVPRSRGQLTGSQRSGGLPQAPIPRPSRRRFWSAQARCAPYVFLLPFVLAFVFFMLYPLARSLVMSFEKMAGGTREARYVGLANYIFLLRDPLFWLACFNTALYAVLLLPIELAASLGLALILNSRAVRFRNFFRFAFFSTYLVGQVFLAVLAYLMLSPRQGLVNRFIGAILPWVGTEMNWRGNPRLAMPAVVLATLWVTVGYAMIYWLAALQAVDPRLYEAAAIDGAGPWMRFRHVTLPGIRPVAIFLILVGTIASLQLFELPYVFFQGPGPSYMGMTIVEYLYGYGIQVGDLGFAAAVGWVLMAMILIVALLQIKATGAMREA